ncbi:hypothetical protein HHK36_018456 [Tetracentron sinense]|uniref:HMA domain-containing protein n=1 Tax=Tetracentron sinense TaxID=13715 RepID=A0A835DAV0_TETSI|nr:hypothetical protein HHK36_032519 [Tetracentron sinense]KAF8396823.1 hypothetical protein HHK36_018456 [Tetracentron sinense]
MADEKNRKGKSVVVEFKVSMHCKACERTVAKTLSKFKGVEKFTTDMTRHKVIVTGHINPEKVLKKLKKKTGKKIEIVVGKDALKHDSNEADSSKQGLNPLMFDDWGNSVVFTMFSDENPNACSIM